MNIKPLSKHGPLFTDTQFKDTKDPCPVFDGASWHIFGSGGSVRDEKWKILHATAPMMHGPWKEVEPATLIGVEGDHVAAPGVVYDPADGLFHMIVQTDFLAVDGTIEYLTSRDGAIFEKVNTALMPVPGTEEAGLYDPHPAVVKGEKYIMYSGTPRVAHNGVRLVSQPNIFLAKSRTNTWSGPWERLGKVLDHTDIAEHHNQIDHPMYEWGIEGPQLIELPDGKILLQATCFLPVGNFGSRQRVFFALGDSVTGPYHTLGPVLTDPREEWESGENGHAAGFIKDGLLYLFYQARSNRITDDPPANDWRYGIATFDPAQFGETAEENTSSL